MTSAFGARRRVSGRRDAARLLSRALIFVWLKEGDLKMTRMNLLLACSVSAIWLGAQAPAMDLIPLQNAVREMCVQPDRKGSYLVLEGNLNAGATLKVIGVKAQGKITKEQWDGISQRLDQYKTDPRACAVSIVAILAPILYPPTPQPQSTVNQKSTGDCSPPINGVKGDLNFNCTAGK